LHDFPPADNDDGSESNVDTFVQSNSEGDLGQVVQLMVNNVFNVKGGIFSSCASQLVIYDNSLHINFSVNFIDNAFQLFMNEELFIKSKYWCSYFSQD